MGIRRKARELALQALYQGELVDLSALDTLEIMCDNFEINRRALPYGRELVAGVVANREAIDAAIEGSAANWRLARMSVIDRNIMRIAVYEFRFAEGVPAGVAIDEAIELAKRYGADDSPAFINGILDAVRGKCD
ncbi:MAG TPA: transcription antitermination factor NusB [Desulfurivibrio alkaliphilus]|uniref:Transcription antitermination protein NusB n=1 Tax=Desulfurivibrio alkaliphilus TaxID=427923 RepID=A0A7C2THM7_9BACT|nr:transcription antitermination factor NusB [Desulfurivibrio alkaliphilus]